MNRAVFFDKDGTLIEDVPYNVQTDLIRLNAGALEAVSLLAANGFQLFVVSNQSGAARGLFEENELELVWSKLNELIADTNVEFGGFYYCPHHPNGIVEKYAVECDCRKPQPGMILQAAREHNLNLQESWFIGDILNDIEAGRRAGCQTILLDVGNETEWIPGALRQPHYIAKDLHEAAKIVVNCQR